MLNEVPIYTGSMSIESGICKRLIDMILHSSDLKQKIIFLAPFNDLTESLAKRIVDIDIKGFFDLNKKSKNVFPYKTNNQFDFVIISSPNYWSAIANNFPVEKVLIHQEKDDSFVLLSNYLKMIDEENHFDVLLIPFNKSNATDLALVARELPAFGLTSALVDVGAARHSNLGQGLQENNDIHQIHRSSLDKVSKKIVVASIDWEKSFGRPYIQSQREKGVVTLGIVDGIEDFEDTDYGYQRDAYQTVEYVLTMGADDRNHLSSKLDRTSIIGLPKLHSLFKESHTFPLRDKVIINVNFTYGSFEEVRDEWVADVVRACQQLNLDFVLCQHHADSGDFAKYPVSPSTVYDSIRSGSLVISRFSTVILESLALGKPVVYYNPHNEKVPIYQDPNGAFSCADNVQGLVEKIIFELENKCDVRDRAFEFLERKCNISTDVSPAKLAAYRIKNLVQEREQISFAPSKRYCLPKNYVSRCEYHHYDDSECEDEWQLEVYLHALGLMKTNDFSKVADFGCGSGYKLIRYLSDYHTVGYELPVNVEILQKKYPDHQWQVSNFAQVADISADVLICSDVIEHLINPDELLEYFNKQNFTYLVISTPERELCYANGSVYLKGPPRNLAHQREWNFVEFEQYISQYFDVIDHRVTNLHQATQMMICIKREQAK
jgi:hypothetical protein